MPAKKKSTYGIPKVHMKDPNSKTGIVCHFNRSIYWEVSITADWDKITCLGCKKMRPKKKHLGK